MRIRIYVILGQFRGPYIYRQFYTEKNRYTQIGLQIRETEMA